MELSKILDQDLIINESLILEIIQLIDLTTLSSTDDNDSVLNLVKKANLGANGVYPAAVCVYSNFGNLVRQELNSNISTAVVGANFPTGQTLLEAKIHEVKSIAETYIDEIDVVINRSHALNKEFFKIENEISAYKKASGDKHLKVILETGELIDQEIIKQSAISAINGGADFIKTSTGKMVAGADPQSVATMCGVIKNHYDSTGKKIGIKPSGGIRTTQDALVYYKIVKEILGGDWINSNLFRIGASSLYDNLINELSE